MIQNEGLLRFILPYPMIILHFLFTEIPSDDHVREAIAAFKIGFGFSYRQKRGKEVLSAKFRATSFYAASIKSARDDYRYVNGQL